MTVGRMRRSVDWRSSVEVAFLLNCHLCKIRRSVSMSSYETFAIKTYLSADPFHEQT
jgi:hypothetical protein